MRVGWIIALVMGILVLSIAISGYFFLYNLDDQEWLIDHQRAKAFFGWQNRKTAKFLANVASNSRIYKGYLTYEARYDSTKRPQETWRGEKLAVVDKGDYQGTDIHQGVSYDTARLVAVPRSWEKESGLLTVLVNEREMTLRVENSTLIYTVSANQPIELVGRGSTRGVDFLKAQRLMIFAALDEYGLPVILDMLMIRV